MALWLALTLPALAQYPGHVQTAKKPASTIRAIAVLEWTGDPGKPKASRIIPISVFDGETYQPGGLYLARPAPLAVEPGTEYVLQDAGVTRGLFDVNNAQDVNGYWFGYGAWKPMLSAPKRVKAKQGTRIPQVVGGNQNDGRPHFKNKNTDDTQDTSASPSSSHSPASDPDRPTLRRRSDDSSSAASTSTTETTAPETAIAGADPDRPHIAHGQQTPSDKDLEAAQLTGVPSELQQMIAVSDASDRETHPFTYLWNDPADALHMQTLMEGEAAKAVLASQPQPKITARPHIAAAPSTQHRRPAAKPAAAPQVVFTDVRFKAFELTYSGGATLVYSADTVDKAGKTKYVTLIAQPDFNGVPKVIFKSVTDQDHLDQAPRMRLIDAVDARANNRGDLIFELRSQHDREFVIYKISGGVAEQVFTTGSLSSAQTS